MPELPEVETVRRGLAAAVLGRTIADAAVVNPRAARRHLAGPADFAARLRDRTITDVRRRGKYLWLPLDDGSSLLGHLGMSGQFRLVAPETPPERHLGARLWFRDGGPELRFLDQRTFGGLAVSSGTPAADGVPAEYAHIAPDPLEPAFDDRAFADRVRRRRTELKRALLDQTLVSGIGNIYADEGLWRARLHYARPTATTTRPELARLLGDVRAVFAEALEAGGTSFDALYVDVNGDGGWFERSLAAYGREGEPCPRCGTPVRRDRFMNRSSYFCPRCQPRPRRPRG